MKEVKHRILIVNYSFPPNTGIGGRRWAKFTKYMFSKDHDISVLTNSPSGMESNWVNDISTFKSRVNYFNFNYPKILNAYPKSISSKIKYRLALLKVKLLTKGNYYDRSSLASNRLKHSIEKIIIKNNIDTVIVSVAPFNMASHIIDLKTNYPKIKFIVDFRDPWIGNETAYGFNSLSEKRKNNEKSNEYKVVRNFDSIVSVAEMMTSNLSAKYPGVAKSKFITIPNGFDLDDYSESYATAQKDEIIRMVFVGTFYNNAEVHIKVFEEQLDFIKNELPNLYGKLSIDFYGINNLNVDSITKKHNIISFSGLVSLQEVTGILKNADVGLLFLSSDINYSFSTKFCEYIAVNLPIVVFSEAGFTINYVETNGIGIGVNEHSSSSHLANFLKQLDIYKNKVKEMDKSSFDVSILTDRYLDVINNIK